MRLFWDGRFYHFFHPCSHVNRYRNSMDEKAVIRSQLLLHGAEEGDLDSRDDYRYDRSQPILQGHALCYLPSNCWKIGVKAAGKYPDGDGWLDDATGWPCAFHGTPAENITSIIAKGLLINGGAQTPAHGATYGKGVYVSPDGKASLNQSTELHKAFKTQSMP